MIKLLRLLGTGIVTAGGAIAGGLVLVLMLAISFEVASRKLLGQSHAWVVDLGEVSLLFITFFAAAWVLRENAHIRIDTLVRLLPVRVQRAMGLVNNLLATGVMLLVALTGAEESLADLLTERMLMGGTVFPRVWLSIAIPVGSVALAAQFGVNAWRSFSQMRTNGASPGAQPPVVDK